MADKKTKSSAEAMATDGFEKELIETLDKIEKAYGKGAIMKLGDKSHIDTEVIPTGSMLIDNALGVGGYPKGRIIEIYGPESSGKTTLALHAIAQTQKLGGRAAFIDAENAIDPEYAAALGVDIDNLLLSQPSSGEEALEITELLANSKAIDLIVVDSVAALVPKAEIEASLDTSSVGTQARMMSKALRRLAGILNRTNTTVIFINQLREKMNTMGYGGPTETTSGGRALKFYASIRIEIKKLSQIKDNVTDIVSGNIASVKVSKNKVAPPFKTTQVTIVYGKGISHIDEVVDCAVAYKFIKQSGAWFSYGDEKIGQGKQNAKKFVEEHPEIMSELEEKIKTNLAQGIVPNFKKSN